MSRVNNGKAGEKKETRNKNRNTYTVFVVDVRNAVNARHVRDRPRISGVVVSLARHDGGATAALVHIGIVDDYLNCRQD
jgi:hypothetical protein